MIESQEDKPVSVGFLVLVVLRRILRFCVERTLASDIDSYMEL